jgi:hypothetical protein
MHGASDHLSQHLLLFQRLLDDLAQRPAEITALEMHTESFGSWTMTVQRNGDRTRISYDGRNAILIAEPLPRSAGNFAKAPRHIEQRDRPGGFTAASFVGVIEFVRSATD